jgi:hypothetical protein
MPHRPAAARTAPLVLTLALSLPSGGCNILAGAYYVVHGPEKVRREFELPRERTTVVFVDDLNSRLPRRALRLAIADQIQKELLSKRLVADVVDSRSAMAAAMAEKPDAPLRVVDVGRSVEADVVIYVAVDGFTLSEDGLSFAPAAQLRVMVTDAKADARLWPEPPVGREMRVRMPPTPGQMPGSQASLIEAENQLAAFAGSAVAQLFYTVEKSDSARARG